MFVKAGRMGNMAADVQAGSKPEVSAFFMQDFSVANDVSAV